MEKPNHFGEWTEDNLMVIDMFLHPTLGEGVYAHVFKVDDKAYKLFLSYRFPQSEEKRRATFQSQCQAYRRAACDPDLQNHIAKFHGTCTVEDVVDLEGKSIKDRYLLDCCYVLEALHGNNAKVLAVRDNYSYIAEAYFASYHNGFNLGDADVFNFDDPNEFKFVDFDDFQ